MLSSVEILKSNREKKEDLVATSRAERGIARHVLVVPRRTPDCLSHLIDGLEARPTGIKGWKPVLPFCITLRSYPIPVQNFWEQLYALSIAALRYSAISSTC